MIGYIFDIFSKYKQVILKDQLLQVVEIFMDTDSHQLKTDFQRCEVLSKDEFIHLCRGIGLKFHHFAKISTLFDIEFCLS